MTVDPMLPPVFLLLMAVVLLTSGAMAWWRRAPAVRKTGGWRAVAVTATGLLLIAAAMRPAIGDRPAPRPAGDRAPNVFLVIDRSPDMTVVDAASGHQITLLHNDIEQLIDHYPGARFAVIGFAFRPALEWPLSADTWSLKAVVNSAAPYFTTPEQSTDAGAAATMLRYQLIGATQRYPQARNLVFYLGAGTSETAVPPQEFNLVAGSVSDGAVLGYGDNAAGSLPTVARQIGVPYRQRTDAQRLDALLPAAPALQTSPALDTKPDGLELYWIPALPAAVLLLIQLYQALRDFGRTRLHRAQVRS